MLATLAGYVVLLTHPGMGQSVSFESYTNPVIPGDHPDCTLTRIGNDFYTTGSSFNPTPVIYHSTDLVHWEAIAQPVSAAWSNYGDAPAGGCWGGQVVWYNGRYWHFFSRANVMHFVTADDLRGTWSLPVAMNCPPSVPGLGYDNSIFIDDGSWYLLVKNGQVNNWIVQLGSDGQPNGAIYDLRWINPAPSYPYSWAEGPVMWRHGGNYYYSFARNVAGGQKVFRSPVLTDDSTAWVNLGDFFNENDPLKPQALFQGPNHTSAVVALDDSTYWVIHPLWRSANRNEWYGQGRQGLLNQVQYDMSGKPTAEYPINLPKGAPRLPSSGIPWMVPHSDFFNSDRLCPEWSFLGYTPLSSYSLSSRRGWLTLSPKRKPNTVIKNDGEHNYSVMTRVDFRPTGTGDQAGIWIFNGLQTLDARLYSSVDGAGNKVVGLSYKTYRYEVANPPTVGDTVVWLKLVRVNHSLTGFCSADGYQWTSVGGIDVADMDGLQPDYNAWTGNRQGLFVQGKPADFDFYIYRDAYTPILAECPANQYGTAVAVQHPGPNSLGDIHDKDWALYAGVEFGNQEYPRRPDSLEITASCAFSGGVVEAWLDAIDTGTKIAECTISNTGDWSTYRTFTTGVLAPVTGTHDLYLRFRGTDPGNLFLLRWLMFLDGSGPHTAVRDLRSDHLPGDFLLEQNYPNPFNPGTTIRYSLPVPSPVTLSVFNTLGQRVAVLETGEREAGFHDVAFNASGLSSGPYFYRLQTGRLAETRTMLLMK